MVVVEFKARREAEEKANKAVKIMNDWAYSRAMTSNNQESEVMIIGKQYGTHPPIVKVGNDKIRIVREMKVLGVIFDNQ